MRGLFLLLVLTAQALALQSSNIDEDGAREERAKDGRHYGRLAEDGPDIAILHPPDGFIMDQGDKLVVAFYVSSFCIQRMGAALKGVRLSINGAQALEEGLMIHGNDGSAQYHVDMPDLAAGLYSLKATLWVDESHASDRNFGEAVSVVEVLVPEAEESDGGRQEEEKERRGGISHLARCKRTKNRKGQSCSADGICAREEENDVDEDGSKCSGHGRREDGVCWCEADWFGEKCDHNSFRSWTYLPPQLPRATEWGCAVAQEWFLQAQALHTELRALHSTPCSPQNTVQVSVLGKAMGAQMHFLALALSAAFVKQKALLFDEEGWVYGQHAGCVDKGWRCYFKPRFPAAAVGCDVATLQAQGAHPTRGWEEELRGAGESEMDRVETPRHVRSGLLVPEGKFSPRGLLWWRSELLSWLTTPNLDLQLKLRSMRSQLLWPPSQPIVGVHVRRGDSCLHAAMSNSRPLCMPLQLYIHALRQVVEQYKPVAVFLATDSQEVVDEASQVGSELGLLVMVQRFDRRVFEGSLFIEHMVEGGYVDSEAVAETTLLDLFLLAECDVLIGGFSSQLSRLALALMAARLGVVPPFVSVDRYSWGHHTLEEMHEIAEELRAANRPG